MTFTSLLQRRRQQRRQQPSEDTALSCRRVTVVRGLPLLWPWAAQANRSKLSEITLAHILSGDTVSPISFPEFEAFLAFCDISLENLLFIVWFQDYRARFDAIFPEENARVLSPRSGTSRSAAASSSLRVPGTQESSHEQRNTSAEGNEDRTQESLDFRPQKLKAVVRGAGPGLRLGMPASAAHTFLHTPLTPPSEFEEVENDDAGNDSKLLNHSPSGRAHSPTSDSGTAISEGTPQTPTSPSSQAPLFSTYPRTQNKSTDASDQQFRDEVQNIMATFFVPGAPKELSLSAEMRETVIREATQSAHPDVFFPAYEVIYETVECVSLPRFLVNASTNINRPRQLFWYLSAVPTFLLGVAIALLFILSPSHRFVLPPQSHRAWRLLSVPCFLLSSMMWYKGFRGFCPLLFLRSSRQLRTWELESMTDDREAQEYCVSLSKSPAGKGENGNASLPTPISPGSGSSSTSRIAPFLDELGTFKTTDDRNDQFCSRMRRYSRPPIFGPDRVVEDKRIRAVHNHLWWSLVRFGLFWAMISAAIVVSVPSLH